MAVPSLTQHQIRAANRVQFVAKDRVGQSGQIASASQNTDSLTTPGNYTDTLALDTYLLTINGGASYTQLRLNTMTLNDKIYAVRIHAENSDSGQL